MTKTGFTAIIGRPNVGKSTLLNQILEQKIVIATNKAQTTRKRIKGIYTTDDTQIIFVDTPGMHKPLNKLGEFLLDEAKVSVPDADVVLFLVDVSTPAGKGDKWITFTYEDERPGQIGDNGVTDDIAYMQVNLFTPKRFDYMELKEKIKSYLESVGVVTSTRSWCYKDKQILIRQTTFTAEITAEREE